MTHEGVRRRIQWKVELISHRIYGCSNNLIGNKELIVAKVRICTKNKFILRVLVPISTLQICCFTTLRHRTCSASIRMDPYSKLSPAWHSSSAITTFPLDVFYIFHIDGSVHYNDCSVSPFEALLGDFSNVWDPSKSIKDRVPPFQGTFMESCVSPWRS